MGERHHEVNLLGTAKSAKVRPDYRMGNEDVHHETKRSRAFIVKPHCDLRVFASHSVPYPRSRALLCCASFRGKKRSKAD
jgi:hypothetical protein